MISSDHIVLAAALLSSGCATGLVGGVRFVNADPVWVVDDRQDVPRPPHTRAYRRTLEYGDQQVMRRATRALEVPTPRRAANVNALGEVPDSTWFQNRVGRGLVTPQDVLVGPDPDRLPASKRLIIERGKPGGRAPGFVVRDEAGTRFVLKFEVRHPEREVPTEVVVQRLLWAIGYHVPTAEVIELRRSDLVVGEGATYEDAFGKEHLITESHVDRRLRDVYVWPDGTMRALISKFLPGTPLGGYPQEGVRKDDPNDLVPHEDRRDLRGQRVFFGWLAHTDVKEDNRLDVWVEDPDRPGHHFVMHYLVDFGKALGVMASALADWDDGLAHNVDGKWFALSMLSLGLWKRPWEGLEGPGIPAVGRFEPEAYDPGGFKTRTPYLPMLRADDLDTLWATKILLALTPAHIEAAVRAARYVDPVAAAWVTWALLERRKKAARHFLSRVNPLGDFEIAVDEDGSYAVCTHDLWLRHRLGPDLAPDRHRGRVWNYYGEPVGDTVRLLPDADGRLCMRGVRPAEGPDGYTMVSFASRRAGDELPPVWVHLAQRPRDGALRVIGVWRE